MLSENDEERFSHDVRCRELLNAGRGICLRVLFRMTDYPKDMIVLYAQGYSITSYLVEKGGGGREGRGKLLQFLGGGMNGNSNESWNESAHKMYGFDTIDGMEKAWLEALRTPPARIAARDNGGTKVATSPTFATTTGGNRTELRSSASPSMPVLEPPVKARAAAPDSEPSRPLYLPPAAPSGNMPSVRPMPMAPDPPPPVLLPPEIPRTGR